MRKWVVVFAAFFAAVLMGGCSSEKSAPADTSNATPQATSGPRAEATPHTVEKLQEILEQEARNDRIKAAVEAAQKAHEGGANKNLPKWVADHYADFEAREYTRERAAFQRSFGWGTGSYKGSQFYWFAHTNTDAFLQFDFSAALTEADLEKVRGGRKDGYDRSREAQLPDGDWFLKGTRTWVGDTNDWTDANCVQPDYSPCDIGAALEKSVADLNSDLPELKLITKGKFPW